MAEDVSKHDREYYESVVAETVKQVSKVKGTDEAKEADAIIRKALEDDALHMDLKMRLRREVLQRSTDLKKKSKDEREQQIVEKFEGNVAAIDGKYFPAGVDENFSVKVRVGNLLQRVWGRSVDADELSNIINQVKDLEEKIKENRVQLEVLKAARESTSSLIGFPSVGLEVGVTKMSLVKEIYRMKKEARGGGWSSVFSTEMNLWNSFKAAAEQKAVNELEYRSKAKEKIKTVEKETKTLEDNKKILEAALQKIEQLRQNGRNLFQMTFGKQLDVLLQNREELSQEEFDAQIDTLRKQVKSFGDNAGITYMEYFLNEAIGIKPLVIRKGEKAAYIEPQSQREIAKEKVLIGNWWKKVFATKVNESYVDALIPLLREKNPKFLKDILDGKTDPNIDMTLQFFFSGKLDGREVLDSKRRAQLSPEQIAKYVEVASRHKDQAQLKQALAAFANRWPSRFKAEDFDFVAEHVFQSLGKNDMVEDARNEFSSTWKRLTDHDLAPEDFEQMDGLVDVSIGGQPVGPAVFREKLSMLDDKRQKFMRFFFTGEFGGERVLKNNDHILPPTAKNVLLAYEISEKVFASKPSQKQLMARVNFFKNRNMNDLTELKVEDILGLSPLAAVPKPAPAPVVTINLSNAPTPVIAPASAPMPAGDQKPPDIAEAA